FEMAHVIPDFIYKAMVRQTPFEMFGDGEHIRTFTHAQDAAGALTVMIQQGVRNDDFNVCGNNTLRMDELARRIWSRVNAGVPCPGFKHVPVPPADVRYRVGVSNKAKCVLGWDPKYQLDYIIDDS